MMKKNLLVLFAFFLFGVVYSQVPTFLNSQSYSAVGAGSAGIPSVSYNIPAGKNRFMVINVLVERHHYPLSSNHPVVPEANGSYLLRANINGVLYDLPGATTARGPNMSTNEVNERSFTFTQFTGLINLETNAVPAGATTVTFPNFNLPGAASDEVSVIISVYENVKTFRTAGTFFPRTTVPSETNLGTITGTFNTSFIPGGRTLADVMFVTNGGITQASALTLAPGSNWTSTSSMKNIVPNTVDWPAGNGVFTTNNTPLGISSVSAYTNITSGVPSYDFTRANTGNIEAGVATMYSLIPFGTPEVSGTVFLDNNGPTTIEGTATNAGGLFVNVINSVGNLVYSAAVNSSGVFTIPTGYLTEGNVYDYQLSKNTGTVGQPAPLKELPASWVTVGESRNTTGNDGLADGNIRFMLGSNNVSDLRYGINQVSWGTPISCNDAKTYVVMQNVTGISGITSLYTVDMITGVTNVVKNPILPATEGSFRRINCIGYNSLDGFIYGYRSQTNQIVKIDALGNYELLTVPNLVTADVSTATAGDIRNNELYIFDNDQRRIWKINLATLAVTIIPFTLPNSNDIFTISINDFAFGLDGNIYGMLTDKRLFKLDLTTNALSYLGSATGTGMTTETGSWGTAFIDAAGNLYVGNNGSRNTYKFEYNLATNTYSLNAQLFSNLEATGQVLADGASCAFVIPPNSKDESFCMQSNTSVQSFPIDVLINDVKGTFDIDPSTVRLINPLTSLPTTTVTIAGQGTFTVNTTTGLITFTSSVGSTGTSVKYIVKDIYGNKSKQTTLTTSICPPPSCTSESSMLNSSSVSITQSGGNGQQAFVVDNSVAANNFWQSTAAGQSLTIDYGQSYTLNGMTYYPSTTGSKVLGYTIQTSTDNVTFTNVATGTFPNYGGYNLAEKGIPNTIRFASPVNARYLRMIVADNGKRVAEIVPLVCGLTPINMTCERVPLISTSTNETATGKKSVRSLDNNWTVTHFTGGTASPTTSSYNYSSIANSVFHPAIVVGRAVVTAGNPNQTWATSPFGNADWISATQNGFDNDSPATGASTLPNTYFYKYKFNIADPFLANNLKLRLDYYVDNQIVRVYINGVDQNINTTDFLGYANGHEKSTFLKNNFQTGINELVVQMYSEPHYAGLLVQGLESCYCVKEPIGGTPQGYTKVGISNQTKQSNWPLNIANGHIALESKNDGFVITRVNHVSTTPLASDSIADPKEGMVVYDIVDKCVKLFNGANWTCIQRTCNDSN